MTDEQGAGRGFAKMSAGLQIYIEGRFAQQVLVFNGVDGVDFGMGAARLAVVAFADDFSLVSPSALCASSRQRRIQCS